MDIPLYEVNDYPGVYNQFLQTCANRLISWQLSKVQLELDVKGISIDRKEQLLKLQEFLEEFKKFNRVISYQRNHLVKCCLYSTFIAKFRYGGAEEEDGMVESESEEESYDSAEEF
uniref:Uncharacterized protein n=2 Tax=Tomato associated geminivirus 1 TaxID=2027645 RepID=A0A223LU24_9GEMI|nr:hypothetical protein [Tomato associated geminivirus 1]